MGETNQTRGLIILDDIEEITYSNTILKMKHLMQSQMTMDEETQNIIYRDARF